MGLLIVSESAVEQLPKAALQELKSLSKPPKEVGTLCSCFLHLFAGIAPEGELTTKGNAKDVSWRGCQKLLSSPDHLLKHLQDFRHSIDAGVVPAKNMKKVNKLVTDM